MGVGLDDFPDQPISGVSVFDAESLGYERLKRLIIDWAVGGLQFVARKNILSIHVR